MTTLLAPPSLFFLYKSSSNMLQDPTCQRPFPAAGSPDIKPQQQGNEDPCREKETMRGWKWQRRNSEGPEERGRDSEGLEGRAGQAEGGPAVLRCRARGESALSWHRDSTRTAGTPNPRRAVHGEGQSPAPAQLPAAPQGRPQSHPLFCPHLE